jgi:hypothetical protein
MRNKLASIAVASSHLGTVFTDDHPPDALELANVIESECSELGRHLDRMQLLTVEEDSHGRATYIMEDLNEAIERYTPEGEPPLSVAIEGSTTDRVARVPSSGLVMLVDAVLRMHGVTPDHSETTTVAVVEHPEHTTVTVRTGINPSRPTFGCDQRWRQYAAELSQTIGVTLARVSSDSQSEHQTTLVIPHHGE